LPVKPFADKAATFYAPLLSPPVFTNKLPEIAAANVDPFGQNDPFGGIR
jgi:hypothetical protein